MSDDLNMQQMQKQLVLHEGMRTEPYHCTAGKLTIGVGRNLDDVGISEDEAMVLLANDIAKAEAEVSDRISAYAGLDEVRKRVLVDMSFNMGIGGLLKFKNMLAALEAGDYAETARQMLDSRWARQVGSRSERLSTMMETGEDQIA
ncbi:MAG: glycoside hydrolase family protein [Magnetococcales bacterium]|nr:glycoside hydrolase family protein [Magnetococcales bacterium]